MASAEVFDLKFKYYRVRYRLALMRFKGLSVTVGLIRLGYVLLFLLMVNINGKHCLFIIIFSGLNRFTPNHWFYRVDCSDMSINGHVTASN